MRIIECCPFFNENLIANIHIAESLKWVDELHLTESNYSFKMGEKKYNFESNVQYSNLFYHKMDVSKLYKKSRKYIPYIDIHPITKWYPKLYRNTAWHNEAVQRNYSLWNANISDEDIVILSDIDEIIDPQYIDILIDEVKKRGVLTIKLHFSIFYFNLFCPIWGGPEDYSYRIFLLRGDVLKKRYFNDSDYLRKLGERKQLTQEVYCLPTKMGFHHSWIGDEYFVLNKLKSYAHSDSEHSSELKKNGEFNIDLLREHIAEGKSLFSNTKLIVDNSIKLLDSVEVFREAKPEFFF